MQYHRRPRSIFRSSLVAFLTTFAVFTAGFGGSAAFAATTYVGPSDSLTVYRFNDPKQPLEYYGNYTTRYTPYSGGIPLLGSSTNKDVIQVIATVSDMVDGGKGTTKFEVVGIYKFEKLRWTGTPCASTLAGTGSFYSPAGVLTPVQSFITIDKTQSIGVVISGKTVYTPCNGAVYNTKSPWGASTPYRYILAGIQTRMTAKYETFGTSFPVIKTTSWKAARYT